MSYVEIVCVVDRSGSMASIEQDAIGGFNSFLAAQKAMPGEAKLSLVLFDHEYILEHDGRNLSDVPELNHRVYFPRGTTALYDAVGKAVDSVGARLAMQQDKPSKVIVVILTDGQENSSHKYTRDQIAGMIKHQQEKYSWEFIFLAANQDAFETGAQLNISTQNTANFAATGAGVRDAYAVASNMTQSYRN